MEKQNLGQRVRELRLKRRLKQSDVAKSINVTNALISALELGDRTPSMDVLISLCDFFHVSADYLLGIKTQDTLNLDGLTPKDKEAVLIIVDSLKSKGYH